MAERKASAALFASRLRAEMASRELSKRQLGRLIDPENPERGRRKVLRHLSSKHAPSGPSRIRYARVLGLPDKAFFDEEEDAEVSVAELLRQLTRDQRRLAVQIERVSKAVAA